MYLFSLILTSFVLSRVWGTLTPSDSVSIDCGGEQTFTCTVAGSAGWTITGLMGIAATGSTPAGVAASARVTTSDLTQAPTSTITITGFSTTDNGGTVQCVDIIGVLSVEGVATISVVSTTLASTTAVMANVDQTSATLTWSEPSDSSATTSVSCTPPSPQCSSCTSSGCTIGGLTPNTSYTFSVTRSRSGCDDSTAVSSAVNTGNSPVVVPPGSPPYWLLLLLLLLIPVIYSICVALVWHFRYKDYHYCQVYWCCCFCITREGDGNKRTSSTEPIKASPPPPRPPAPVAAAAPLGEYADPKDVRKRKEENKIQYADLEFTKQSGGGQGTIHQKEEPVTYTAIQHA